MALPEPFRTISHFNPFFYLIDGFRLRLHRGVGRVAGDRRGDDRGAGGVADRALLVDVRQRIQAED